MRVTPRPFAGIDEGRLSARRRERLFAAMADRGIDVLLLGVPANVRFAADVVRTWTAGTRAWSVAAVAVLTTRRVHLLGIGEAPVPGSETARAPVRQFGLAPDASRLAPRIAALPGVGDARVVASDGWAPGIDALVAALGGGSPPQASVHDATAVLEAARAPKDADEVRCLTAAAGLAADALAEAANLLVPGIRESTVAAALAAAVSRSGWTAGAGAAMASATAPGAATMRLLSTPRPLAAGDLVVLGPVAQVAGYEAGIARTASVGDPRPAAVHLADRARAALERLLDACRPGRRGADLVAAFEAAGGRELPPGVPLVCGAGLGAEPPVVGGPGRPWGRDVRLRPGQVLTIGAWMADDDVGGVLLQDLVAVTDGEPEVLEDVPRDPLIVPHPRPHP